MRRTSKFTSALAVAVLASIGTIAGATGANAMLPESEAPTSDVPGEVRNGALDPATFEGELIVAVPSGHEVIVTVEAGEAPSVIEEVQAADATGSPQGQGRVVQSRAGCGEKVRSVAGMFGYSTSVQGCAVAGYPGYQRSYSWSKTSDTSVCTKGKGFNGNNATWFSTSCSSGSWSVPWGNVLAYTQMQGMSLAGVVGATYDWRA
ncbi:hypothetical protein [Leifsonia naganoensis]|uniref:Secreted protein n=1 Tax=Leifsonia naganoensis TaxID=150025 RepID=A0A853DW99_9MICO|nr:hypothetical protein [Leifsonia naganoensis]NYK10245.1 hypothetical protein [Leifsonia naganoensis]